MNKNFFSKISPHWEYFTISIIMLMAAFMRFYHFASWSLSNDELSALNRLHFDSFSEMIKHGVMLGDFHPAGVQAMLWFWVNMFGDSVWAVRFPFVLFGTLSVGLVYLIGKRWFGPATALFAAAALAFLQYPILYSQLARPYAPGLFFSLATVWFWTKIVFDQKKPFHNYAGFTIFAALAAYTHHYSFLFVILVGFSGLFFTKKTELKKYLLASLVVGMLYLPHLQIFVHQFGIGGVGGNEGWLSKPEHDWILNYLWYAFNESWMLIVVLASFFLYSIFGFRTKLSKFHLLAISWFLILFLIGYFYSLWRNPILQFSILIFSFPFLILFIFSFFNQRFTKRTVVVLFIFLTFGFIQTTLINKFYQQQHFGEFKGVAQKIEQWNRELGNENISNVIVVNGPYYINYYLEKLDTEIKFLQYDNRGGEDLLFLKKALDSIGTPNFVYAWTKPAPEEIDLMIREKYPCIVDRINFGGLSEVTLYGKNQADSCISLPPPVWVFSRNFDEKDQSEPYVKNIDTVHFITAPNAFRMDSLTAYSPGFKATTGEINLGNVNWIEMEISAFSPGLIKNAIFVLSLENNGESYLWRGSPLQNFIVPGKWGKCFLSFPVSEIKSKNDVIKVYCWNPGRSEIFIDNLWVRFYNKQFTILH